MNGLSKWRLVTIRYRALNGVCLIAMAAAFGHADPSAAQAISNGDDSLGIESIVVTAQKRQQILEDVPLSIQAFGGAALEDAGIRDISEIMTLVPGATEEQSWNVGQRAYQIRGITQGPGDPTVGYYIDDIAFSLVGVPFSPIGRSFDLGRVEILRGPQSTLYGAGSMGGTVRYISNQPDLKSFGGQVDGGYSFTDGGKGSEFGDLEVNVPIITDKMAVRVSGSTNYVGGYQDLPQYGLKDANSATIQNLRATVLYQPTEDLTLKFTALSASAYQNGGTFLHSLNPPVGAFAPGDYNNVRYAIYSGTVEYDFGPFIASSTTSVINFTNPLLWDVEFDVYGNPAPGGASEAQRYHSTGINNETRLVSAGSGPLNWIVGSFYASSKTITDLDLHIPAFGVADIATSGVKSDAESVFGEVSYEMFDHRLVPLVGLRYFTDQRSQTQSGGLSHEFNSVNPRFNLTYKPDSGGTYYLNIAKGFRSGDFNNPAVVAIHLAAGLPAKLAVNSDALWSYEVGAKKELFDRQLMLDTALYYEDWQGTRALIPYAGQFLDYQAGNSRIYGVDQSIIVAPQSLKGFTLNGSFNWNSAEYVSVIPLISTVSGIKNGDRLPFVPPWTFAANATYKWDIDSDNKGEAVLGFSHIAATLGQSGTSAVGDPRNLLRARLGVTRGPYSLALVGTNLLQERGAIYSQVQQVGFNTFTQDYPRTIGIEGGVKF